MSFYCDELQKRVDDCTAELYQKPLAQAACSLTTKIYDLVVVLQLTLSEYITIEEERVNELCCAAQLLNENSYCEHFPGTIEKFWEEMKTDTVFSGEVDNENLPSVQTEKELLGTCFSYVLLIPNWDDRDDFFLYPFVQEVMQRVLQDEGETLETLKTSLKGIDIPSQDTEEEEKSYVKRRKNEIIRLLALYGDLLSPKNRWILDTTGEIVRSYWEVMHKFKIQRAIQECAAPVFSTLSQISQAERNPLILDGEIVVEVTYGLEGEDEQQEIAIAAQL